MYHVGQPPKRRHWMRRLLVVLLLLVVAGSVFGYVHMMRPDTVIHQATPQTTEVSLALPKKQQVTKAGFQLALPEGWKEITEPSTYTQYSWVGTGKEDNARRLEVYIDKLPATLAVNRLLPLQAQGAGVTPTGTVSDNCINFTDKATANPQTGAAPAKWSGVSFLCDTANTLRDVVGTGSAENMNSVSVTGETGLVRHVFFVYTDHSGQANYDVFTDMLASFKVL
jgi:hypothetical protein